MAPGDVDITTPRVSSNTLSRFAPAGLLVTTVVLAILAISGSAEILFRVCAASCAVISIVCVSVLARHTHSATSSDEQALRDHLKTLETESITDPVTGLGNVRSFQMELQREIGRAARHGHAIALALIEVDAFAQVADLQGNLEGDRLLARLASSLGGRRAEDRTFRLTGGEFGLILPYTTAREVYPLMENLRMESERGGCGSTVTIGVADLQGSEVSESELRRRAESALSEAKRNGRNAVVAFASRVLQPAEQTGAAVS